MDCLYCGEATGRDVPRCFECHSLAENNYGPDLYLHLRLVKAALVKKHRKFLTLPQWDDEDLEELGPLMRAEIEAQMRRQEILWARISYVSPLLTNPTLVPPEFWEGPGART